MSIRRLYLSVLFLLLACAFAAEVPAQSCDIELQFPRDTADGVPLLPALKWEEIAGATYDVYLGTVDERGCSSEKPVAEGLEKPFLDLTTALKPGTKYEWKVVAKGPTICRDGQFSICGTFTTTNCPSAPPKLLAPTGGTVTFGNVTFEWEGVPDASNYDFYISVDEGKNWSHGLTTLTTKTIALAMGQNVLWYVIAKKDGCTDQQSQTAAFSTSCPTSTPSLLAPLNDAKLSAKGVAFEWKGDAVASSYTLEISSDGGRTWTQLARVTTTSHNATLDDGTYDWRVFANYANNCSALASEIRRFTIASLVCPASPARLIKPVGGTVAFGNVDFEWESVPNTTVYDFYLSLEDGKNWSRELVNGTTKSVALAMGQSVLWYVVAKKDGCADQTSDKASFSTSCPTAAPSLISPLTNATFPEKTSITFQWKAELLASSYTFEISTDGGRTWTQLASSLRNSEHTATLEKGEYDWRVAASYANNCPPVVSESRHLTVGCPSDPALPDSPADGAEVELPFTLSWKKPDRATRFTIYAIGADDNVTKLLGTTDQTSFTVTSLEAKKWLWYVDSAYDDARCPAVSSNKQTIIVKAAVTCPQTKAQPQTPANGASNVDVPVIFEWKPADGSIASRLYVSFDGGTPFVAATTNDSSAKVAVDGGVSVSWYIESVFDDRCGTTKSDTFRFSTAKNTCPANPGKANITSPANGATGLVPPITILWPAVAEAVEYRVLYGQGANLTTLGTTTQTTLTADVPSGDGYLLVQTFFGDNCATTLSDRVAINVASGQQCSDAAPVLVSPADGEKNVPTLVTFKWNGVKDAIKYLLYIFNGREFELYDSTDQTSIEKLVPTGTVRWYVVAMSARCPETKSAIFTFEAGEQKVCPEGKIELKSPAEGATVNSPVRASWSGIDKALLYRVYVAPGRQSAALMARTTSTEVDLTLSAGDATWFVEAELEEGCDSIRSAEGHFTVRAATNCADNKPATLVSPVGTENDPAKVSSDVDLKWEKPANAVAFRVWISANGGPYEDVGFTTDTHLLQSLKPGKYNWYVQTIFENCDPQASAKGFFEIAETRPRCSTAQPVIISPAANATVPAPITILWSAVEGAIKYRAFAAHDGGAEELLGTTSETSLTVVLDPGIAVIRIEAVFPECPSTYSQQVQFTIRAEQNCSNEKARITAPQNGSTHQGEIDVAWDPVNGAIGYLVLAQHDDGAPTVVAETSETRARFKPPAGKLLIIVVTLFRGCDSTESAPVRVEITVPPNCDNRAPILLLPSAELLVVQPPAHLAWTKVPLAVRYLVFAWQGNDSPSLIATTTGSEATVDLRPGTYKWLVQAQFPEPCPATESAMSEFTVGSEIPCDTPAQPRAQVVGHALSNTSYAVRWESLANVRHYELQQARTPDFSDAETFLVGGDGRRFSHNVTQFTQFYYRVRGVSDCKDDERGLYSDTVGVVIGPEVTNMSSAEIGADDKIVQKYSLPGSATPRKFKASTDKPWAVVTPSEGTIGATPFELTITIDQSKIDPGTNTFTLFVEYQDASAGSMREMATPVTTPLSVSLVTPVTPSGKGTPPPDALIFSGVGHAVGQNNSLFESDVRVTNLSAQKQKYQIIFTPTGTDGTVTGSTTTVEIAPNKTLALDDIVSSVFGIGTTSSALGMLEVRPVSASSSSGGLFSSITSQAQQLTLGSSRTYNFTANGTFGQFVPATPFSKFVGSGKVLSLLHVAQSTAYRANFGFLEASGKPVDLVTRVYDVAGNLLATIPVSLQSSEHRQFGLMLAANGITDLQDGRVEVEVVNGGGKITAYVSEVDNATNDPFLVSAVEKGTVNANRYVIPGMAHKDLGFAFWVSDLRVYNSGNTAVPATLTFYAEGNPGSFVSKQVTIDPGEIEVLNDLVQNLFGQPNGAGGSVVITTPQNAPLGVTARTYNKTSAGTYGQYLPGVTVAESVGLGQRALHILQVEHSSRMRTNIALTETSGKPVKVEVSLVLPDSIATPFVTYDLQGNEFRQISVGEFGVPDAIYNGRVTVKVIGGAGTVTTHGSLIDAITNDPALIPPQ